MKIIGVIPARYGSTRFDGKPLTPIAGKPLLQWVVEGARTSLRLSELVVATDDRRIFDLAIQLKVKAVMTEPDLPSGTDRVWAAVKDFAADYVINIQGDEPLITGDVLDLLATAFDQGAEMATLARRFTNVKDVMNPGTAKIVINQRGEAVYFSRLAIPHSRVMPEGGSGLACLKHIGIYGYKREFLNRFCTQKPVEIERAEALEQLRALWLGARIKVVETDYESWGVDTPEDVVRVEQIMKERSAR